MSRPHTQIEWHTRTENLAKRLVNSIMQTGGYFAYVTRRRPTVVRSSAPKQVVRMVVSGWNPEDLPWSKGRYVKSLAGPPTQLHNNPQEIQAIRERILKAQGKLS